MNEQYEIRWCGEFRQDGNILTGTLITYGEVSPTFQERFLPGAFGPDVPGLDVILNSMHQRSAPIARTGAQGAPLVLTDSPQALTLRADLAATQVGRDTHELVRAGVLRGLSVEFLALREDYIGGIRNIHAALLGAAGVVDSAAYVNSMVEARQQPRRVVVPVPRTYWL